MFLAQFFSSVFFIGFFHRFKGLVNNYCLFKINICVVNIIKNNVTSYRIGFSVNVGKGVCKPDRLTVG